jgi:hypothetical protein
MKKHFLITICFLLFMSTDLLAVVYVGPFQPESNINGSLRLLLPKAQYQMLGVYYFTNPTTDTTVNSSGAIKEPLTVQWVDLTSSFPSVVTKPITATLSNSELKKVVNQTPVKYPSIKSALTGFREPDAMTKDSPVGGCFSDPKTPSLPFPPTSAVPCALITSVASSSTLVTDNAGCNDTWTKSGNMYTLYNFHPGSTRWCDQKSYNTMPSDAGAGDVSPSGFAKNLTGSLAGGAVNNLVKAEIDKMMSDPNYVPVFSDDTTGLPYSPPSSSEVAPPAQVAAYNKAGESVAAAGTAATSAAAAAAAAATASGIAAAAAAAAPGDAGLANAAAAAAASAAAAKGVADKLAADLASLEAADAKNASIIAPAVTDAYGAGEKFEIGARFQTFIADMKTSGLFALPSQLLGNIPGGGQSYFDVSFGRMGSTRFDLASFGSGIAVMRILVLIVFSFAGFKIVTLKGGSG